MFNFIVLDCSLNELILFKPEQSVTKFATYFFFLFCFFFCLNIYESSNFSISKVRQSRTWLVSMSVFSISFQGLGHPMT